MDFTLPDEFTAIREAIARFVDTEWKPVANAYEDRAEFPYPVIEKMGTTGLFGAAFPEDLGGTDLGFLAVSVISEEISRLAPELGYAMNMQAMTCPFTIYNWGTEEQIRRYVPDLIAGRKIGMFGLTEAGGGSDAAGAMRTTARRDGDVYRLNGSKMFITFSHACDAGLIFARTDPAAGPRGITAFIVEPKTQPGFRADTIPMSGLSRALRSNAVFLDDVTVPVENRLGEEGEGIKIALNALEYGRLTVSARLVGLAQACLDRAIAYAGEREVGGRAIAGYQMVQQIVADATVMVDAARLMSWRIGWTMDRGERATRVASRGKYFASIAANKAAATMHEVYGGYALTDEYPCKKLKAYVDMLTVGEGTENVQRILIAEDALNIKDANRHPVRNRARGGG